MPPPSGGEGITRSGDDSQLGGAPESAARWRPRREGGSRRGHSSQPHHEPALVGRFRRNKCSLWSCRGAPGALPKRCPASAQAQIPCAATDLAILGSGAPGSELLPQNGVIGRTHHPLPPPPITPLFQMLHFTAPLPKKGSKERPLLGWQWPGQSWAVLALTGVSMRWLYRSWCHPASSSGCGPVRPPSPVLSSPMPPAA